MKVRVHLVLSENRSEKVIYFDVEAQIPEYWRPSSAHQQQLKTPKPERNLITQQR
jgi:hypothetical protein